MIFNLIGLGLAIWTGYSGFTLGSFWLSAGAATLASVALYYVFNPMAETRKDLDGGIFRFCIKVFLMLLGFIITYSIIFFIARAVRGFFY